MSEQHDLGPASLWKLSTVNPQRMTMRSIAERVAEKYSLTVDDLKGDKRARHYAWPRQEAMYEMRQLGKTLPQIGEFLGGKDHTTVLHGVRRHAERMGLDD